MNRDYLRVVNPADWASLFILAVITITLFVALLVGAPVIDWLLLHASMLIVYARAHRRHDPSGRGRVGALGEGLGGHKCDVRPLQHAGQGGLRCHSMERRSSTCSYRRVVVPRHVSRGLGRAMGDLRASGVLLVLLRLVHPLPCTFLS